MSRFRRAARVAALVVLFGSACGGVSFASPTSDAASDGPVLEVPFLPQTEALCGGAAAAMLFRYWGDRHADVQQFAPLVDRQAGGIADTVLIDALRERHWTATRLDGSVDTLRTELQAQRPSIILIEDRPQRYHYVVVVGLDRAGVLVHDPTWGPSRHLTTAALEKAWAPTGFWLLRVVPTADALPTVASQRTSDVSTPPHRARACDGPLDTALDAIKREGIDGGVLLLQDVARRCPDDARPLGELAAIRFTQQRWNDATALAQQALAREPANAYAADVLGSSRFMAGDLAGALRAWNITGRPVLDSVHVTGLTRTRYARLTDVLGLEPGTPLSARAFALARRRLEAMPDLATTRLSLRPGDDGFAAVDVAVAERPSVPRSVPAWGGLAARAALERELARLVPGRTGQGETWTALWRWWEHRPAAAIEFAAPMARSPRGVWRVGVAWSAETYGTATTAVQERQLSGTVGLSTWLTPKLRLGMASGLDSWHRIDGRQDKAIPLTAALDRRLLGDRLAMSSSLTRWLGPGSTPAFTLVSANVSMRTSGDAGPLVVVGAAGASAVSAAAPLMLWGGAGEGRARPPLLRAHALLDDGRIDGPVFGRRLAHASVEVPEHWTRRPSLVRLGAAAFIDLAAASRRRANAVGLPFQTDVGVGMRLRAPGAPGTLRVDYAHGLRDGADAVTVGWQIE